MYSNNLNLSDSDFDDEINDLSNNKLHINLFSTQKATTN